MDLWTSEEPVIRPSPFSLLFEVHQDAFLSRGEAIRKFHGTINVATIIVIRVIIAIIQKNLFKKKILRKCEKF